MLTHLSLFTGVGGFDLGFGMAEIETVAQCENDRHAIRVLEHHWPDVKRHEDINELDGTEYQGVDIISGGFPCQDLSVAGRREGLTGARSGLFFQLARVVEEARPRLLVWENVPGLLSSDNGNAMRAVCGELADIGYFGAWRVLDSQFHGVPQSRRRVIGAFASRSAGGWACGAAVLLDAVAGEICPSKGRRSRTQPSECVHLTSKANCWYQHKFGGWREGWGTLCSSQKLHLVSDNSGLRWLTPREKEAMQGFPDSWTDVDGMSDTQRHRQLGNAVSVPVAYWLGLRAKMMLEEVNGH